MMGTSEVHLCWRVGTPSHTEPPRKRLQGEVHVRTILRVENRSKPSLVILRKSSTALLPILVRLPHPWNEYPAQAVGHTFYSMRSVLGRSSRSCVATGRLGD